MNTYDLYSECSIKDILQDILRGVVLDNALMLQVVIFVKSVQRAVALDKLLARLLRVS